MLTVGEHEAAARVADRGALPVRSGSVCDPRVAYIVVLRPAEEDEAAAGARRPFPA